MARITMPWHILLFGVIGGLLIVGLKLTIPLWPAFIG